MGLGDLRDEKTGLLKHKEWRGFKDTFYDYYRWLITWKDLSVFIGRAPIVTIRALFRYRWMGSYLATPAFIDKASAGQRGSALRVTHLHFNMIVKSLTDIMTTTFRADKNLRKKEPELSKKIIYYDELIPPLVFAGFPNLKGIPAQAAPIFVVSMIDQNINYPYIDAVENYGLPSVVCPLPEAEAGLAIEDDFPLLGSCFISSSMPCDGSIMTSSFQERRFKLPTFNLFNPERYEEQESEDYSVQELKDLIAFVEKQTGEKFDLEALKIACERFNASSKYELEKWEFNRTDLPQVTGETLWLYRLFFYQISCGYDKRFVKNDKKVNALISKAYAKGIPSTTKTRHRAVIWSCPANYYTDFPLWLENCWGITALMDMESNLSCEPIDTTDLETTLHGIARTYASATMRKHTKGGYTHVLNELWKVVEEYNADLVILYQQISCKGMAGLTGMFEEQAKARNIKFIWVDQDLMDSRTISRRSMREQVNNYMRAVLQEEPLDPSLEDFNDTIGW